MVKKGLTTTQEKVFNFLKDFIGEKGYPPTLREIAAHFGLKGPKANDHRSPLPRRTGRADFPHPALAGVGLFQLAVTGAPIPFGQGRLPRWCRRVAASPVDCAAVSDASNAAE